MSAEQRTVVFTAYRDDKGRPTCGDDFRAGRSCAFILTRHFGQVYVCAIDTGTPLNGYDSEMDYLKPHIDCPIWKGST